MPVGDGSGTKYVEGKAETKKRNNPDAYPDKGTKGWQRNEKHINNNMALKKARDVAQGIVKKDSAYTSDGGKGSAVRSGGYSQEYKDNFDKIFGNKDKSKQVKRTYKLKVNGVYVDKPDDE